LSRTLAKLTVEIFAVPVAGYIKWRRDRLGPRAAALSGKAKDCFRGYFSYQLLESTRLVVDERLLVIPSVAAITLDNVIAAKRPPSLELLFHELVHVVQFRQLGVREFSRRYVAGYTSTRSYRRIPLEVCAFSLEDQFLRGERFDVEMAVADWLASEREPNA
jgi:hypothetical protein